jgi:hypothetical protein
MEKATKSDRREFFVFGGNWGPKMIFFFERRGGRFGRSGLKADTKGTIRLGLFRGMLLAAGKPLKPLKTEKPPRGGHGGLAPHFAIFGSAIKNKI